MTWKCRCNKRACQARRSLRTHPDDYVRGRPKCHIPGCEGRLYALKDQTGAEQHGKARVCRRGCLPFPHRTDDKNCEQYVEKI